MVAWQCIDNLSGVMYIATHGQLIMNQVRQPLMKIEMQRLKSLSWWKCRAQMSGHDARIFNGISMAVQGKLVRKELRCMDK